MLSHKDLPLSIKSIDKRVGELHRRVNGYLNTTRQEPLCFLFYGPPGCGKSTLLQRLIKEQPSRSVYTHASVKDRDFYDTYENEDIFVLDDLGQKGVYQWADIINMVSTIRYPLCCAEADKKGTKFFTSDYMFFSSNVRPDKLNLTADCGITDLNALCRRIKIFDFSKINFKDGHYTGVCMFKIFNVQKKVYEIENVFEAVSDEDFLRELLTIINKCAVAQTTTNSYTYTGKYFPLVVPGASDNPIQSVVNGQTVWVPQMMKPEEDIFYDAVTEQEELPPIIRRKHDTTSYITVTKKHTGETRVINKENPLFDKYNKSTLTELQFDPDDEAKLAAVINNFSLEENKETTFREDVIKCFCNFSELVIRVCTFNFKDFDDFLCYIKEFFVSNACMELS